ncbi:MAG: hypothetical protein ACLP50_17310 [Solirubrobacteraceae bacterium]
MPGSIHPKRLTSTPRALVLAVAALLSGVLVAGCGGTSPSPTTTDGGVSTPASTPTAGGGGASSGASAPGAGGSLLAFAKCMRANGVPNLPDPNPETGAIFVIPAGTNPAAPAFRAAQAKCRHLLPGGGPTGAGAETHPSAQTLAKLLKIARCMRQHGVLQFPDPETSVPSDATGYREITDFDGAILLFPRTINMQSPAYRQALAACGAPPLGLHH